MGGAKSRKTFFVDDSAASLEKSGQGAEGRPEEDAHTRKAGHGRG